MGFGINIQASLGGIDGIYACDEAKYGGNSFDHGRLGKSMLVAGNFGIEIGSVVVGWGLGVSSYGLSGLGEGGGGDNSGRDNEEEEG